MDFVIWGYKISSCAITLVVKLGVSLRVPYCVGDAGYGKLKTCIAERSKVPNG
jgi:hypothetical protein